MVTLNKNPNGKMKQLVQPTHRFSKQEAYCVQCRRSCYCSVHSERAEVRAQDERLVSTEDMVQLCDSGTVNRVWC
jgi:hypothetical protein